MQGFINEKHHEESIIIEPHKKRRRGRGGTTIADNQGNVDDAEAVTDTLAVPLAGLQAATSIRHVRVRAEGCIQIGLLESAEGLREASEVVRVHTEMDECQEQPEAIEDAELWDTIVDNMDYETIEQPINYDYDVMFRPADWVMSLYNTYPRH